MQASQVLLFFGPMPHLYQDCFIHFFLVFFFYSGKEKKNSHMS